MIAFFDTSVHVALLRGDLSAEVVLATVGGGPVRLSPVVASELLRGARGRAAARAVSKLVDGLVPLEPPSWRRCWLDAGRVISRTFRDHEEVGLARLQNDVLLALTARATGATFVTLDRHFSGLTRHVAFRAVVLPS